MTDGPQPPEQERTTDENEPTSAASPASPPADESPAAAPTPSSDAPVSDATAPFGGDIKVVGTKAGDDDAEAKDADEGEDEEPLEATRLSPYAVASFVLSLFALFQAPQNVFQVGAQQPLATEQFLRFILPTMIVPVAAAVVGLWLSFRAEEEIFVAGGRFGGVGLYRAARVVTLIVLLVVVLAVLMLTVLAPQPQQPQFGQFG